MEIASKWIVKDGGVDLETATGQSLGLAAMEVFQAAFGAARKIRGEPCGDPLAELPDVIFSRYPAEPAIRVFQIGTTLSLEMGVCVRESFVRVPADTDQVLFGKEWFPIQMDSLQATREWLKRSGVKDSQPLTIGSLIAVRTRTDRPAKLFDDISINSNSMALTAATTASKVEGIVADLYRYQSEGVSYLELISDQGVGCILADEMGLGKTLQIIALLQSEKNVGRRPQLVVAPATLLENWRRELVRFAPGLSVHMHAGANRPGIWRGMEEIDVTLVSYDTVIRDEILISAIPWNVMVLDEAQNIKNPDALRTCAVKKIPRRVSIAVTGTPLENKVDDLWSITDFAMPGMLGSIVDFRAAYSNQVDDAALLGELVAPAVLRRKVAEVAQDLPAKIEIPQPILMSARLANEYENLRKAIQHDYGNAAALVSMTKLRMCCAHPALTGQWSEDLADDVPKYRRLIEILEEVFSIGEKALIFSTFTGMADLLLVDLQRKFQTGFFKSIDGRLQVNERQATVDDFFAHVGGGALILNPKAAGVGLNITAANHVIHYNPEWNPALTAQATARAYRRKQERPVTVHHLFYVGTLEEVIVQRAEFKSGLAAEAVTGHEGEMDPLLIVSALGISPLNTRLEDKH